MESVWNQPFLNPNYLNNKDIKTPKGNISVVIATYNRAPYPNLKYNPLSWALSSVISQKKCNLKEVVIVDDGSVDYTKETVDYHRNRAEKNKIQMIYLKNKENMGLPKSLNKGGDKSKKENIFFMDDDCILSDYSLFGASYSMNLVDKINNNVALMHIPVYGRTNLPLGLISLSEIGRLDFENTIVTNNNHLFPKEYLSFSKEVFLDYKLKMLKPIEVNNIGGVYLIKKDIFKKIGGICEKFDWPNFYGEHTDFSIRLNQKGFKLFLTPDPKFFSTHLKYGLPGKINYTGIEESRNGQKFEGHSLEELVLLSSIPRENSGCRVDLDIWSYSKIMSHYIIFSRWDKKAGNKWKDKTFGEFVVHNLDSFSAPMGKKIINKDKREKIWKKAIRDGDAFLRKSGFK
jgi:glycosyltransferase involved in cell wall biosynthesis